MDTKSPTDLAQRVVVGFTGTQVGMTPAQATAVDLLLKHCVVCNPTWQFSGLHGDCLGADADFDAICKRRAIPVKVRPASLLWMRAYCASEAVSQPKPPLVRNRDIVADSAFLIACPQTPYEVLRSGTWATIRAMRRKRGLIYLVAPDGTITTEGA